ncbi:MAG: DNA polymerase I, partial [Erysipelotrichaceae bacterium]|nr:DNA polymerase I [Erysipelotrichaceae bacterium]
TSVWLMKKGITEMERMTPQAVYDRFELQPLQIIDLKGLSGDPSDNIPGVTKVGDKTAIKMLKDYGSVEGVYEHIDELKGKLQENLINDRDMAFLSKQLATIKTDAEVGVDMDKAGQYDFQGEKAMEFYSRYELRSFMHAAAPVAKEEKWEVANITSFRSEQLRGETALVLAGDKEIQGLGIVNETGHYYINWQDALKDECLRTFLQQDNSIVLHDVKRWYHLLEPQGIHLSGRILDMMIACFLLNSKIKTLNDLLVSYHITVTAPDSSQTSLFEENEDRSSCVQIADGLLKNAEAVRKQLDECQMSDLYWNLELPLAEVLYDMEDQGIRVLPEVLDRIAEETSAKITVLEQSIYELAGKQFNINSPKQLAEVIYDDLKLMKSTKRSTDASVLKKMEYRHPIISQILEYRKYAKLNSTYAIGLKKYIQPDGKIHTEYNQCIAETGRLSSSNPNLQNISVRNEETQQIRAAFIPDEGCVFVGADYSQVELRMLAHMADEDALIEAFRNGMDIHTKTAMDVFGVSEEEVTPLMRRQAKAINFGIDYGMSDFGLAEQLGIPVKQAHDFIDAYYARYPHVREFMNRTIETCQQQGYVTTLLNRRREIPEINSSNYSLKEFGKRAAMNAPVQGSAADLIKVAMVNVYRRLKKEGLRSRMILQIHDELILNVPEDERERLMIMVEEEMEQAMELKVPLVAQTESGLTWLEVK